MNSGKAKKALKLMVACMAIFAATTTALSANTFNKVEKSLSATHGDTLTSDRVDPADFSIKAMELFLSQVQEKYHRARICL